MCVWVWHLWLTVKQPKSWKLCSLHVVTFFLTADVEAFAKAMESETKSEQEGDAKDKKDDDEDMSLDWEELFIIIIIY